MKSPVTVIGSSSGQSPDKSIVVFPDGIPVPGTKTGIGQDIEPDPKGNDPPSRAGAGPPEGVEATNRRQISGLCLVPSTGFGGENALFRPGRWPSLTRVPMPDQGPNQGPDQSRLHSPGQGLNQGLSQVLGRIPGQEPGRARARKPDQVRSRTAGQVRERMSESGPVRPGKG